MDVMSQFPILAELLIGESKFLCQFSRGWNCYDVLNSPVPFYPADPRLNSVRYIYHSFPRKVRYEGVRRTRRALVAFFFKYYCYECEHSCALMTILTCSHESQRSVVARPPCVFSQALPTSPVFTLPLFERTASANLSSADNMQFSLRSLIPQLLHCSCGSFGGLRGVCFPALGGFSPSPFIRV